MIESILGVDPSTRGTGLCVINIYEPFVVFDRIKFKEKIEEKTFVGFYERILEIDQDYKFFLDLYRPDVVIMETPLPSGQMAPALSSLATRLSITTLERYPGVFFAHPSYLRFLLHKGKYDHKELVNLVRSIVIAEDFIVSVERFSADEAVAFLLAFRIKILMGYKCKLFNDNKFRVKKEVYFSGSKEEEKQGITHLQRLGI